MKHVVLSFATNASPTPNMLRCTHCQKLYPNSNTLKLHIRYQHNKLNMCPHCHGIFTPLRRHIETHSDNKIHKCLDRTESFNPEHKLRHHKVKHSDILIKTYCCQICEKKSTHLNSLRSHMLIHRFQKDLACSHCSKSFASSYKLNRHVKIHKPGTFGLVKSEISRSKKLSD